jgi:hypothetical protein
MQFTDQETPLASLRSFMEDLANTITVARTLVDAGNPIDLGGFDQMVGLLCAQTLDLPLEDAKALRDDLIELLAAVDALSGAFILRKPRM